MQRCVLGRLARLKIHGFCYDMGGGAPPEAGPMGESGCGYWCAPFGFHRAGAREGARYGYRGVMLVRPPTLGLSHPPLTSRVPRRRGRF